MNRTEKQSLDITSSCYFPYYVNLYSSYFSQSSQGFLNLVYFTCYIKFISVPWMAFNELICGFLITTELIFSIQILEKCSQRTGNFPKGARPRSLFYAAQLYHSEHILCYMYRSPCKLKCKPHVMKTVEAVGQETLIDNLSRNLKFIKIYKIHKLLELLRNILSGAWSKFVFQSACNRRLHWRPQVVSSNKVIV